MFIFKIGKNNKLSSKDISRLVRIHRTPQDEVAIFYTDTDIPNGFAIYREDKMPADLARENPQLLKDRNFGIMVANQAREQRRQAELEEKRNGGADVRTG